LRAGDYTEDVGQSLRSCSGRVAASAGWLAFDAGRHADARAFYHQALADARVSGDEPLAVLALASMSLQATYLGAGHEALDLARAAQSSPAGQEQRTASILAVREARALARMMDSAASAKAIARARAALDRAEPPPESASWASSWVSFQDHAELIAAEGLCRADIGDHSGARQLLQEALAALDPAYSRNRALYTIRLADAALALGEIEEACALATAAVCLAAHIDSRRVGDHIRAFRRRTGRYSAVEAAQTFNDRCDLVLSSQETA
jgi:tetratricopeptide (TPR) repeat protein